MAEKTLSMTPRSPFGRLPEGRTCCTFLPHHFPGRVSFQRGLTAGTTGKGTPQDTCLGLPLGECGGWNRGIRVVVSHDPSSNRRCTFLSRKRMGGRAGKVRPTHALTSELQGWQVSSQTASRSLGADRQANFSAFGDHGYTPSTGTLLLTPETVSTMSARFHRREILCSLCVCCLQGGLLRVSFGLTLRMSRSSNTADSDLSRPWAYYVTRAGYSYFESTTAHMGIHEPRHPRNWLRYPNPSSY